MNTRPFNNTATQREKREVLRADIDALRRAISPDVGPAVPVYPRLPAGPWSQQPQPGVEAPLGYSVNALGRAQRKD